MELVFKESDRYKQSHKALRDAKSKYAVDNAVVTGHSLGHAVANGIRHNCNRHLYGLVHSKYTRGGGRAPRAGVRGTRRGVPHTLR